MIIPIIVKHLKVKRLFGKKLDQKMSLFIVDFYRNLSLVAT